MENSWKKILEKLKESIAESAMTRWLLPIRPRGLDDKVLTLEAPNKFSKNYIEDRYIPFIQDAARDVTGMDIEVRITATERKERPKDEISLFPPPEAHPHTEVQQLAAIPPGDSSSLNPKYTFDTFVAGDSNKLAHAAAMAVAATPGKVYNPLFLYGGVGLGKTHLMHAIGHQIIATSPKMRVLYISSEKFTNELINSIRDGNPESFRQKYRGIDVLLVDDIQFLHKKEHTQEEFFHTFNALYDAGKAIIISSDRKPRDIQTLEDRLRSRFEWGLITDVQAPNLEMRIAILKKKALLENLSVPNEAMYYIASRIENNIRELEGALTRVVAFASLSLQPITVELAAEAMKNTYPTQRTRAITLELIQDITASYFKLKVSDLLSGKRTKDLAFARQVAMYLCRELTDVPLKGIAGSFNKNDHTTVLHAHTKISNERREDQKLDSTIKELVERIERT